MWSPSAMLLVRILIAKIEDEQRLLDILSATPLRPLNESWSSDVWVKEGYERLWQDEHALGTKVPGGWLGVRDTALWYIAAKAAKHRFDDPKHVSRRPCPTWDMIKNKEQWP